jgi:hypothetical protein
VPYGCLIGVSGENNEIPSLPFQEYSLMKNEPLKGTKQALDGAIRIGKEL